MAIELIVVDLDGTLLNEQSELSERNEKALKAAMEKGVKVVIATGKTRYSANTVVDRLGLTTPGIYLQGLTIYKPDGSMTSVGTLSPDVARQVITFAEDRGFLVLIYSGTKILTRATNSYTDNLTQQYHEPAIEGIGPLQNIVDAMPVHKIIAIKEGDPKRIKALRWQLEMQLDGRARLTQAMIPDMLEILPPKGSKGAALKILLKDMGIKAEDTMVIGDGENDIEMMQMAGTKVAVGNADDKLKAVAEHIVATNNDSGVADAVEKFVLDGPLPIAESGVEAVVDDDKGSDS